MSASDRSDRSDRPVLDLEAGSQHPDRSDRSYAEPAQTELILPFTSSSTNATWCGAAVGAHTYISTPYTHRNNTIEYIEAEAQIKLEHKV